MIGDCQHGPVAGHMFLSVDMDGREEGLGRGGGERAQEGMRSAERHPAAGWAEDGEARGDGPGTTRENPELGPGRVPRRKLCKRAASR
jgi:hypothetical protein